MPVAGLDLDYAGGKKRKRQRIYIRCLFKVPSHLLQLLPNRCCSQAGGACAQSRYTVAARRDEANDVVLNTAKFLYARGIERCGVGVGAVLLVGAADQIRPHSQEQIAAFRGHASRSQGEVNNASIGDGRTRCATRVKRTKDV